MKTGALQEQSLGEVQWVKPLPVAQERWLEAQLLPANVPGVVAELGPATCPRHPDAGWLLASAWLSSATGRSHMGNEPKDGRLAFSISAFQIKFKNL